MKNIYIVLALIVVLALVGGGAYFLLRPSNTAMTPSFPIATSTSPIDSVVAATTTLMSNSTVIGASVEGRPITAYHYGTGSDEILFVGGIHGGYSWNTALVAYDLMGYLEEHPEAVSANERVTVIPVLNPDGLEKIVGTTTENFTKAQVPASIAETIPGRFNANNVDLNRNFDCDWHTTGVWLKTSVSGGSKAFSEPESQAIEKYVSSHTLTAVVVWFSAAGGVYSSSCSAEKVFAAGVSTETTALTKVYADASGYPGYKSFDLYVTTGDMVNWLAKQGIPAISVLLTNHTDTDWSKNQAGITAVLNHYAK